MKRKQNPDKNKIDELNKSEKSSIFKLMFLLFSRINCPVHSAPKGGVTQALFPSTFFFRQLCESRRFLERAPSLTLATLLWF